ncbi:BatD family protein [Gammaproteobacteria bacterium]|nr:BatD family protein [Gammaproteobacteria bacterium]MDB4137295.1 BatD family protein [Gammaproteobacteria bacterium]
MVRLISAVLFAFAVFATQAFAQQIELSVDRNELARGETLTLTIRVYDQRQGMQLDLTPLTQDFDVLGTRTSSQIRSINGVTESWTDYVITLFPEKEGELTIPALSILNQTTDPISINVVNAGPRSNQGGDDLYLEIEVNKDSVYVQEQLLFTVRLFYTINGIRNPVFTELEMEDTVTQLIGSPNQYERLIDGERFGVYEKRYVIFPQRSGPLQIPDILFRGEVTDGSSNFVFRNMNTRRVTAFIEGITIEVKERPASLPRGEGWLPVTGLALEETWSGDLGALKVGDSVVRTLTLRAEGLDGAVLPPFSPENVKGLNLYPDPADISRTFVDGSIVGTRIETTTYVALEAGVIEVPSLDIAWWDVNSDSARTTSLPATRFEVATVEGVLPSEQAIASTQEIQALLEPEPLVDQAMIDAQAEAEFIAIDGGLVRWTQWLLIAFVLLLIAIMGKRRFGAASQQLFADWRAAQSPAANEKAAFAALNAACASSSNKAIRDALITWANHYCAAEIRSMEDLVRMSPSQELTEQAKSLQSTLFNPLSGTLFDSAQLRALTKKLRQAKRAASRRREREVKYQLPSLYKS